MRDFLDTRTHPDYQEEPECWAQIGRILGWTFVLAVFCFCVAFTIAALLRHWGWA